jgi:release factor glutamine methyltransferase
MFVQTNTVEAVKNYFRERLKAQFSESEIRQMLKLAVCERLNMSAADYLLSDRQLLSESDLLYFRSIVKRLQNNEPFQYIIGHTEFSGLIVKTDNRGLIPRPETEELVCWILDNHSAQKELNIIDLCTGSGCIALALKAELKGAKIIGADVSCEALALANENSAALDLEIEWMEMDLLDPAAYKRFEEASFDSWVSNPPYIPHADKTSMAANVLEHEPHLALFVEDHDPLIFYRVIAQQGKKYLKKGAALYFEIHEDLADAVVELLEENQYQFIEVRQDLQGKNRMVKAIR